MTGNKSRIGTGRDSTELCRKRSIKCDIKHSKGRRQKRKEKVKLTKRTKYSRSYLLNALERGPFINDVVSRGEEKWYPKRRLSTRVHQTLKNTKKKKRRQKEGGGQNSPILRRRHLWTAQKLTTACFLPPRWR